MKKLVLFIVVLHSIVSFAQDMPIGISEQYKKDNNYYIDMEIGFWGRRGGRRICEIWSKVYVNNENKYDFSENDYLKHLPFSFSSLPKEIRYEGYLRRRNLFGDCSGDSESFDYIIPVELCKREYRRTEGDNHGASLTSSIRIYIVPLHTLTTEKIKDTLYNSYLPIGEKVKLFAKEGFPSELYNYQIATKVNSTRVRGNRYIKTYNWQNLRADLK
ncbi:MAG: hypothetical protein Q4C98_10350, partial [Capnocytophaga sp.]|nr:hypothetical protein [Capnocytophaga sp.]